MSYLLPSWKDFPKRDSSFICTTSEYKARDYAFDKDDLYHVFPENGANLGICSSLDIWDSCNIQLSYYFNAEYIFKKSRKKSTALKTFLMDNAVVVGVGNIYANETLFLCGLHPMKLAENLTRNQCVLLVETIKNVLAKAITQGGTTLKDFLQPDGRPGYFAQELLVYGNKDKPCPKCGTKIESMIIGQRNSFYCPHCQKKK